MTKTLSRLSHVSLAAKGAARRGGYFDPENVPYALEAVIVLADVRGKCADARLALSRGRNGEKE